MRLSIRVLSMALALGGCAAAPVARSFDPKSAAPIAAVVTVPPRHDLVFVSGARAKNVAAPGPPPDYGTDTKIQALSVLKRLKATLAKEGLSFADVTTARVFLVGDPKLGGKMDFAGFNDAFRTEFGSAAQPNRPTRAVVQVVGLPAVRALVEMDLIAARAHK